MRHTGILEKEVSLVRQHIHVTRFAKNQWYVWLPSSCYHLGKDIVNVGPFTRNEARSYAAARAAQYALFRLDREYAGEIISEGVGEGKAIDRARKAIKDYAERSAAHQTCLKF